VATERAAPFGWVRWRAFSRSPTTVRQDFAAVERNSIGAVLDQIESGPMHPPPRIVGPATLVVRTSTAAPG
jgi:DNA-binding LacI/PurR family transcriptional regulator